MKNKYKLTTIIVIISIMLSINISKATTIVTNELNTNQEYSTEYKKWLALPEDERKNYIMPSPYTINLVYDEEKSDEILAKSSEVLPKKYDLRDYIQINVKDQKQTGSCEAMAATSAFEITQAKLNNKTTTNTYSTRHMLYSCAKFFKNGEINEHGFTDRIGGMMPYMSLAYYASGKGPILETDMPFENNSDLIEISEIKNKKTQAQLEDCTLFPYIYKAYGENNEVTYSNGQGIDYDEKDIEIFRNRIKQQIMNNGPIVSHTNPSGGRDYFGHENNLDYCYNPYFCNNTNLVANHTICIIGWDDEFSKLNFTGKAQPANDGAYLVLNSWGSNSDWDGCYWISYDDYFIELDSYGFQNISDVDYDYIYQYDELGPYIYVYSEENTLYCYGANIFKKQSNKIEKLTEIGLNITYDNTNVEVYLNRDAKLIATANNLTAGYHVLKVNTNYIVDNTFSIIVKYSNDNNLACVPIESPEVLPTFQSATANKGESFFSSDGIEWQDVTDIVENANVCIKAFTIVPNEDDLLPEDYIKNSNLKVKKDTDDIILYGVEEKIPMSDLISSDNYASGYTIKAYKDGMQISLGNATTGTIIKLFKDSKEIQSYTVVIYGDTTGDGNIAAVDALAIVKNKLGIESFKDAVFEEAGRTLINTRTLKLQPSAVDALAVVKHKLNIEKISQY